MKQVARCTSYLVRSGVYNLSSAVGERSVKARLVHCTRSTPSRTQSVYWVIERGVHQYVEAVGGWSQGIGDLNQELEELLGSFEIYDITKANAGKIDMPAALPPTSAPVKQQTIDQTVPSSRGGYEWGPHHRQDSSHFDQRQDVTNIAITKLPPGPSTTPNLCHSKNINRGFTEPAVERVGRATLHVLVLLDPVAGLDPEQVRLALSAIPSVPVIISYQQLGGDILKMLKLFRDNKYDVVLLTCFEHLSETEQTFFELMTRMLSVYSISGTCPSTTTIPHKAIRKSSSNSAIGLIQGFDIISAIKIALYCEWHCQNVRESDTSDS